MCVLGWRELPAILLHLSLSSRGTQSPLYFQDPKRLPQHWPRIALRFLGARGLVLVTSQGYRFLHGEHVSSKTP